MAYTPFGQFGQSFKTADTVDFRNIRGGVVTSKEIILAGGTQGVIRSQNYDPTTETGWAAFGDGSASFYGDVTIGEDAIILGDVVSGNWDGADPADLSSGPITASTGFYLDSSAGAAQFQELFVGGSAGNLILQSFDNIGSILFNVDDLNFEAVITSSTLDIGGIPEGTLSFSPAFEDGSRVEFTLFSGSSTDDAFASFATFDKVFVPEGTESVPGLGFTNHGDHGFYASTARVNAVVDGNTVAEFFRFSAGNEGIRLPDGTATRPSLAGINDVDTGLYWVGGNLHLVSGSNIQSATIRDQTTGSAANVHVGTGASANINRSTSSLRYKPGWQFADEDELAKLELPNPITWIERNEDELEGTVEQDIFLGFGTEHIEDMLPAAVQDRDGDGRPDNYDVRSLVAILSAKVKRLEREVAALQK